MRLKHPLHKLKAPKLKKTENGLFSRIIRKFENENQHIFYNIILRGQNALPLKQYDVDIVANRMHVHVHQMVVESKASILSLNQEINDMIEQLSIPLDSEKPEPTFIDKAFSTWNKIQTLRRSR